MKNLNPNVRYPKDARSLEHQLESARYFFAAPHLPTVNAEDDSRYADKDGLVQFIVAGELIDNEIVMAKLQKNKENLIALTSIVTDYVNRYAAHYGQREKTNIKVWEYAMSQLPLMAPGFVERQTYSRQSMGISVSKDFIEFIMGIVVSQGASALNGFQKFLEKQGEALELGLSQNRDGYDVIAIGVTSEVFTLGKEVVYTPKIEQYRIHFTRENTSFNGCCTKAEYVNINFEYQHYVSVFDYEALNVAENKAKFEEFINKSRQAQIQTSSTFFNADFPPKITC